MSASRAVWDLARRLYGREAMGTCYLVLADRGCWALVVPELRVDGPLARLCAFSAKTVRDAQEMGLVVLDPQVVDVDFRYAKPLDWTRGQAVSLTEDCRRLFKPVAEVTS